MHDTSTSGRPSRAPGLFSPLTYHGFRLALGGRLLALTGGAAQAVTLALLVLDATGLPSGWGTILTVQAIPQVLLILVGGVAVDRFRPLAVIAASNLLQGAALVPLLALTLLGTDRVEMWHLYAYAIVSGIGAAFFIPASQTIVPDLVPTEDVRSANALWVLAFHLSRFVGPPIVATLAAESGHPAALASAIVLFVLGTAILLPIRVQGHHHRSTESPLSQIVAGIRFARKDAVLWTIILSAAIYNFGASGAALVGLPSLAKLTLDAGDQGVGILFGALGGGALIGIGLTSYVAKLPRQGIVAAATNLGVAVALALAGLAPSLWAAVPCLVVTGAFQAAGGVIFLTLVQTRTPVEVRGRVMSLLALSLFGLTPLAYGLGGILGDVLGPRGILLVGAGVVGLTGVLLLTRKPIRAITSG
jgi:MFS family permease